jgi:hypothetical protein
MRLTGSRCKFWREKLACRFRARPGCTIVELNLLHPDLKVNICDVFVGRIAKDATSAGSEYADASLLTRRERKSLHRARGELTNEGIFGA